MPDASRTVPGAMFPTEECRSCHAQIYWTEKSPVELNDKGLPKTMPVDAASLGQGPTNVVAWPEVVPFEGEQVRILKFRYLSKKAPPIKPGERYVTSHFATCPDAGSWRK